MTSTSAAPDQPPEGIGLAAFNALPAERARDLLLGCCHAGRWAAKVTAGRPYPALDALLARAGEELTDDDVPEALAGHPRIGQAPAAGQNAWSQGEQAGIGGAEDTVLAELAAGNHAYEERFGHIYLVCASGRSASALLGILKNRLRNGPDAERQVVRGELGTINDLRLTKLIGGRLSTVSTHVLDSALGQPAAGVPVRLERMTGGGTPLAEAVTGEDGRVAELGPAGLAPGTYRVVFDTGAYFARAGQRSFYPEVVISFLVEAAGGHYHVPLVLSPFGYATYRGS